MTLQKWGGLASFTMIVAIIAASFIYLVGDLRATIGPFAYSLADVLYGPVWAASLVTAVFAVRERIGLLAQRRMSLALLAAVLAAGMLVLVACLRAANRHYHLVHPELHLENASLVLVVWTTLIAGVNAAGWHFLGWTLALTASAGWTSARLPRGLCALYLAGALASLFVFVFPDLEGFAIFLSVVWGVWQGILLLWRPAVGAPVEV
jgi:hypothetical protein